jgi:hypothetical protein
MEDVDVKEIFTAEPAKFCTLDLFVRAISEKKEARRRKLQK